MSRLTNAISPLEVVTVTYRTPYESYNAAGTLITDTTEPAAAQISYTVQASDVPSISGNFPFSRAGLFVVGGKNLAVATKTLGYKLFKNGTQVASGTHIITANYYWTLNICNFFEIATGDVITVKLWCTADGTSLDFRYVGYWERPSRVQLCKPGEILKDFTIVAPAYCPFTQGLSPTPYGAGESASIFTHYVHSTGYATLASAFMSIMFATGHATYGVGRVTYGDTNFSDLKTTSVSALPSLFNTYCITSYSFRRVRIE